ncbi:hypothetical protein KKG52_00270 [Patescibacteria group bacterium]|nr:hypothetical protein [Patescibacteria group bacterium]
MLKKLSFLIKKEYLILYFIIFIGAILRLPGIFTNSFAFTYDVGRDMLALWDIVYVHKIPLIGATTGLPGVFYGPWWYYLLSIPFLFSFGDPQGIALTMSLFGIATIIMAYFVGKRISGVFLGLCFSGLIAVSSDFISLSSQIWNPNIAPLFVIFIIFILVKIYSFDNAKIIHRYFFILGILLALNIDFEIVFGVLLLIGVIASLIWINYKIISLRSMLAFSLGVVLIFSPRIIFELRHQFLMTKSFIAFLISGNSSNSLSSIMEIFVNRLSIFFNLFNFTLSKGSKSLGLIFLFFIIFTLFLFYKNSNSLIKKLITTSLIIIGTFLIGTTFFSHDIWPHYLVGLPVFYTFIFSCCLYLVFKRHSTILIPLAVIIIFLVNLNPIALIKDINKPMWKGDASVYRNQLEIIDYVYSQSKGKSFKYVVYTPPVHDYPYRYLFKWYGPKKYHYLPSDNSNLAYFILEPDLQYPSRLVDWLKSREKDGKIIKTERFKSGIIVQTRIN